MRLRHTRSSTSPTCVTSSYNLPLFATRHKAHNDIQTRLEPTFLAWLTLPVLTHAPLLYQALTGVWLDLLRLAQWDDAQHLYAILTQCYPTLQKSKGDAEVRLYTFLDVMWYVSYCSSRSLISATLYFLGRVTKSCGDALTTLLPETHASLIKVAKQAQVPFLR